MKHSDPWVEMVDKQATLSLLSAEDYLSPERVSSRQLVYKSLSIPVFYDRTERVSGRTGAANLGYSQRSVEDHIRRHKKEWRSPQYMLRYCTLGDCPLRNTDIVQWYEDACDWVPDPPGMTPYREALIACYVQEFTDRVRFFLDGSSFEGSTMIGDGFQVLGGSERGTHIIINIPPPDHTESADMVRYKELAGNPDRDQDQQYELKRLRVDLGYFATRDVKYINRPGEFW